MMNGIHVGFIPDGNRRWLRREGLTHKTALPRLLSHWFQGLQNVLQRFEQDPELQDITALSVYMLSRDNLEKRTNDGTHNMIFSLIDAMYWITFVSQYARLIHIESVSHIREGYDAVLYIPLPETGELPPNEWVNPCLCELVFGRPVHIELSDACRQQFPTEWVKACAVTDHVSHPFRVRVELTDGDVRMYSNCEEEVHRAQTLLSLVRQFQRKCRIRFVGERNMLPQRVQNQCSCIEAWTDTLTPRYTVQFALAYDPVLDLRRELSAEVRRHPIDLIIRTSGEQRSSGFLPLDSLYSEWVYCPRLFPDFTMDDLVDAVREFRTRERRFGQ